ncbi:MAG: hypothetical protein CVU51_03830 [Deltaproteobacteria bacterium HGW-Deltaproteobacteria-1]|nr:MAG: hypothetical protein CVU51_03830 [Deltaproteobacteria bacterium HGW-Deltaproteobacteria-1]
MLLKQISPHVQQRVVEHRLLPVSLFFSYIVFCNFPDSHNIFHVNKSIFILVCANRPASGLNRK